MYTLDVICNRFHFGEVQEEVIDQCSGQGISAPRAEGLSVYQWSVPDRVVEEMPLTPLKFLGLLRKFWKSRRSLQVIP